MNWEQLLRGHRPLWVPGGTHLVREHLEGGNMKSAAGIWRIEGDICFLRYVHPSIGHKYPHRKHFAYLKIQHFLLSFPFFPVDSACISPPPTPQMFFLINVLNNCFI